MSSAYSKTHRHSRGERSRSPARHHHHQQHRDYKHSDDKSRAYLRDFDRSRSRSRDRASNVLAKYEVYNQLFGAIDAKGGLSITDARIGRMVPLVNKDGGRTEVWVDLADKALAKVQWDTSRSVELRVRIKTPCEIDLKTTPGIQLGLGFVRLPGTSPWHGHALTESLRVNCLTNFDGGDKVLPVESDRTSLDFIVTGINQPEVEKIFNYYRKESRSSELVHVARVLVADLVLFFGWNGALEHHAATLYAGHIPTACFHTKHYTADGKLVGSTQL